MATDPKTGKTISKTVTAEIIGEGPKNLVKITVDTDGDQHNATTPITAANGHLFWLPTPGGWVDVGTLQVGDTLQTTPGNPAKITHIQHWTQQASAHNLTIADLHTYYVLAGETPVLVHNSGGCNVADGRRLQARLAAEELAGADGHAFQKHVVEQGEFPGIRTREQFSDMIEGVILNGERRVRSDGASAYWRNGVVVIRNPGSRDGGTVFAPQEGYRYFTRNFRSE
ncbi:polymorphic toxin-type HINT domain-containing protein [Streptomyces sp. TP-A0874]|uniref:polymorphic toxin-type HINT domain-containing protein n=1 Tax=Streptomyces sp. TP-A0874 TaxID=549819 RepID=UPI001FCD65F0|nr:polymorphic toxin-type HINT domain-containing protein [Streptomyces sp. TP-A0874]